MRAILRTYYKEADSTQEELVLDVIEYTIDYEIIEYCKRWEKDFIKNGYIVRFEWTNLYEEDIINVKGILNEK